MKALVLAPFDASVLKAMAQQMEVAYESWTDTRRLYDPEELAQRLNSAGISILITEADFLFEELFRDAQRLSFVGVCRAALNHVDLEAATAHGVVVVNTPARNAQAVAELTLGLILSLARRIPQADSYVKTARWQDPVEPYIAMTGWELRGKTLGIVGLGAIGQRVARTARALGMNVVAYDPYVGSPGSRKAGATLVALLELLSQADVVTLHTPDTPETQGLIGPKELARMKREAYLVSMGSPHSVEPNALAAALREGRLAGAAFDVHESHPIPPTSPFFSLDNVILTPHIGGATRETVERHSRMVWEDIQRFLAGRRPRHLVNKGVWRHRRGL